MRQGSYRHTVCDRLQSAKWQTRRFLSPVRLPSTWHWKQVGLTVKLALWQAVTSPLFASTIGAALG